MKIRIDGISSPRGHLRVAVYNRPEGFLEPAQVFYSTSVAVDRNGSVHLQLPELPVGWYALSCFHDVNSNGVLDKNLLGIPTEPYAFSNGARPKFRAPSWEESRVYLHPGDTVDLHLEQW